MNEQQQNEHEIENEQTQKEHEIVSYPSPCTTCRAVGTVERWQCQSCRTHAWASGIVLETIDGDEGPPDVDRRGPVVDMDSTAPFSQCRSYTARELTRMNPEAALPCGHPLTRHYPPSQGLWGAPIPERQVLNVVRVLASCPKCHGERFVTQHLPRCQYEARQEREKKRAADRSKRVLSLLASLPENGGGKFEKVLCEAKTRKGTPCQCAVIPGRAKCGYHGGLSTGPHPSPQRLAWKEEMRKKMPRHRKKSDAPTQSTIA